jgi:maleate isomerase
MNRRSLLVASECFFSLPAIARTLSPIALFHPPWFADDVVEKGVAYFQNQGFEVVHASHLTLGRKVPHPNSGSHVTPAEVYEWVRKRAPSNMECAFIAGNGFRTIGVIAALEEDLGLYSPGTRWRSGTSYVLQVWEPKSMITARCSETT